MGVELECTGFDFSALSEFRDRLAESGRADALPGVVLERLKDAGLLRERGRARTDATQVLGAVRVLNRIETCGETLRVALEAIAEIAPGPVVPLSDAGWHERYSRRVETGRLLGRGGSKTGADALAGQIGADGAALLARIDAQKAAWADLLPEVRILRVVWDRQYEPAGSGRRLKAAADLDPSARRIHSPHDPEVRYSAKGRPGGQPDTEWVGTKAHLTESCDDDLPHRSPTCTPPPRPIRTSPRPPTSRTS